ncbi:MAG TPA: hypothetical protein VGO62_08965 [Myxococcota bacterium]|jgi:hypothetical protein
MATAGDDQATPDELLLELMDLVVLAFPAPLRSMKIEFVEADDHKRPALKNLDGIAMANAPARADLGHDDNLVLDAINEIVIDMADATMRQGGVRVLTGRIDIKDGPDGDRFVTLVDASVAPEVVAMERRFDRSELRWLFYTAPLYRLLAASAPAEREQRAHTEAALVAYDSFQIDMQRGEIAFSNKKSGATHVFAIDLLGSWADDSKRFLWGWANEQAPARLKKSVDALRAAATEDGLRALTEPSFGCPEPCAERLARHAAARMPGTLGVYRAGFQSAQAKGFLYVALREPTATG